jgi:hypothetical protein
MASRLARHGSLNTVSAQESGKVFRPSTKLGGAHAPRIIPIKNAKDLGGESLCNGSCHAHEALDEKVDGISEVEVKGRAGALRSASGGRAT